jgi:hypothetical protein
MPKGAAAGSSQGGLVYLKYTFRYRDQFDEPNDDWLNCVEATSDELLGAYTRAKDDAMSLALGGRVKRRLNRVFDVIGFVYPDYCYPSRKQGKKRKVVASAISATPKDKKIKVLTHRPRYIETTRVPKLAEGPPSVVESEFPAPAEAIAGSAEELILKTAAALTETEIADVPKCPAEAKAKTAEEPELRKSMEVSKLLAVTPKRRRMASVLDAVMESTRVPTPASIEVPSMSEKNIKETAEAITTCVEGEVGPSIPAETGPVETIGKDLEKEGAPKKVKSPTPEASTEELDFIIRHASGKQLSEEQIVEAKHYARDLKYSKGSLVYNGTDEDDFLYCLLDNKEISVCWKMARNIGFLKLELGLSTMLKDDLADNLAYNSLKVKMF